VEGAVSSLVAVPHDRERRIWSFWTLVHDSTDDDPLSHDAQRHAGVYDARKLSSYPSAAAPIADDLEEFRQARSNKPAARAEINSGRWNRGDTS
jgi:hypothetical protein